MDRGRAHTRRGAPARGNTHAVARRPGVAPRRTAIGGFTLLEIMVVMVIIAAAAVLGVMALNGGFERSRLHGSTKQIAANLRYTRAQAIATGVPQKFEIDPRGRAWQAPNGRHGTIPDSLDVNFIGAREVQPQAGVGAIMFFDDGASTGGRVQIAGTHAAWNVDVAWLTGEVTLHRANAGDR
ncbi:MAG: type II secretion system protein XpsH [Luteimonas sp.]